MDEYALWTIKRTVRIAALLWAVLAFISALTGREGMPHWLL
jgi:hypothetical protein